ncbi:SMI1/KNR4 family protein [Nonomuraea typhae]|uniref:SMI1/KNR4 family protein n=1 Tax=Nonomuraea typhae TaxID=2603600 RepID=A0ABW7YMV9_9ACTN
MLKLVRVALTAAILVAIGVRLRRRTRGPEPVRPPAPAPVTPVRRKTGSWAAWAVIAAVVAVVLVVALVPTTAQVAAQESWARFEAEQAETARRVETAVVPTPAPQPSPAAAEPDPSPGALGAQATCTPVRRPVRIRPIDPAVKRQVTREWRRIERWLKANAPRSYRELPAPGRARTIAIAESQMGMDFPDGLRASLLRHNGSGTVLPDGRGLGIREIRDTWRDLCRAREPWWEPGTIPLQWGADGSLDVAAPDMNAVLNLDVGEGGIESVAADSFTEWLRETADALESGGEDSWQPRVKRGRLTWELDY